MKNTGTFLPTTLTILQMEMYWLSIPEIFHETFFFLEICYIHKQTHFVTEYKTVNNLLQDIDFKAIKNTMRSALWLEPDFSILRIKEFFVQTTTKSNFIIDNHHKTIEKSVRSECSSCQVWYPGTTN